MAYEQTLFSVEKLKPKYIKRIERLNRSKSFLYGYNDEFDMVVISKDGVIDPNAIYTIQGLKIAIPKPPKNVDDRGDVWSPHEYPEALKKIRSIFDWNDLSIEFKENHIDYIENTFKYRDEGYWFMNEGKKTYITGSHYMFCTWSFIDIGLPHYREANRLFWYFWKLVELIIDLMVYATLRTDVQVSVIWLHLKYVIKLHRQRIVDMVYCLRQDLMLSYSL